MNQLNPLFERNFVCPVCHMKFTSLSLRSSAINLEKRESDFNCIYRGLNPLHYSIIVCPTCKYAASNKLFAKELPTALVNQLAQALTHLPGTKTNFSDERDLDIVLESFIMAIRSAQLKKADPGELAGLLMGAAWICREAKRPEQEITYLEEALKYYLLAFQKSTSHIGNLTDVQAAYLIGELYLRLGNYTESVNWFNRTIVNPNIKTNPSLEKQTREQWQIAREAANKQKTDPNYADPDNSNNKTADSSAAPEKESAPAETSPAKTTAPAAARPRTMSKMMNSLYNDQIDWLNQIVNQGYGSSKSLVNKEQVLRSIVDAFHEYLGGQIPDKFSNEAELKEQWLALLSKK